jgi:hypothetical protein
LEVLRANFTEEVIRALLAETPSALPVELQTKYGDAVTTANANATGVLDRLRFAIRLQVLEMKYHEVGGLYDQLLAAGKVDPVVVTPADIERATLQPPPGGRASIRGQCIQEFRESGWVCDWRYLFHAATGKFVDLRDPFVSERRMLLRDDLPHAERPDLDLVEMLNRLTRR